MSAVKVGLVGQSSSGKTQLMCRLAGKPFTESFQTTIGLDFLKCEVLYDGEKIGFQVWDTGGHERFQIIVRNYYGGFNIALVCYDVATDPIEAIRRRLAEVQQHTSTNLRAIYVVGCKADQKELIPQQRLKQMFSNIDGSHFLLTSALTDHGVSQLLATLASEARTIKLEPYRPPETHVRD